MKNYNRVYQEEALTVYYLDSKLHRIDGPAIENNNAYPPYKEWRIFGELHRDDGPAIEWSDGVKSYFLYGNNISKDLYWYILKNKENYKYNI